jgi:carboxymethylenebutenolidase
MSQNDHKEEEVMRERRGKSRKADRPDESRRDFLKGSAAAAGAGLVATTVPGHSESKNMRKFSADEERLIKVWEAHTAAEFERKDANAAMATMTDHPVLVHVPVGTGASGREALRKFYAEIFIPQIPPDMALQLLTRTVGQDRVIDEFIVQFTHSLRMDWFAPGIEPTGRRLRVPHVGIIAFEQGKIASEHIYWDQATVLLQLGVVTDNLPILAEDQAERLLDPGAPANVLIDRL